NSITGCRVGAVTVQDPLGIDPVGTEPAGSAGTAGTAEPVEPVRRRGGLWHHLDFRRLWIGETVSQFGTMVSQLALPLVAILVVHASIFEVGLLTAFETAAFLVVGLP